MTNLTPWIFHPTPLRHSSKALEIQLLTDASTLCAHKEGAGIAQSVLLLATLWRVRGSDPGAASFPGPNKIGHKALPASCICSLLRG